MENDKQTQRRQKDDRNAANNKIKKKNGKLVISPPPQLLIFISLVYFPSTHFYSPSICFVTRLPLDGTPFASLPDDDRFLFLPSPDLQRTRSTLLHLPFQRGIIRPMAKLTQKHQQLWEAQSAENMQLWTIIGQLQSELADYKSRLNKLEAEISSRKPAVEEPVVQVHGTPLTGQPAKRGRPRKSAVLVDVLPTPNESCPRARGRKPAATCKVQSSEARTLTFEKVILNKVEDKEKACHSLAITQQPENDEKISNLITKNCGNLEENPRIQILDNADDSKTAFSILSEQDKSTNGKGSLVTHTGTTANGSFQNWSSDITPESCGRNVFTQGFCENGSVIRQGEKHIPGWSFIHEDNASEQLEDAVVGSVKDDNDKEMVDDATSGGEDEIAPEKVECAYPWMVR
ncbi:hypothetical protein KPL70_026258 [Citrus sinensis]|nr:hypothetical protein KPL70_026258 [Citrus sinensis]